ncbi:MAG: hypothetical protein BMS9Abin12_0801 [Acidimicrobiia bacterium]|nr:MAG: hypothetical protein BMS9Abin12_0801 [Acidimicrobiia bacterium]
MILEREAELVELGRLVDEAESSGGRVVLVRGEAAIAYFASSTASTLPSHSIEATVMGSTTSWT